jgi:hypothetical protein
MTVSDIESSDEDVGQVNKNMNFDQTFAEACSSNEPTPADSRGPE